MGKMKDEHPHLPLPSTPDPFPFPSRLCPGPQTGPPRGGTLPAPTATGVPCQVEAAPRMDAAHQAPLFSFPHSALIKSVWEQEV